MPNGGLVRARWLLMAFAPLALVGASPPAMGEHVATMEAHSKPSLSMAVAIEWDLTLVPDSNDAGGSICITIYDGPLVVREDGTSTDVGHNVGAWGCLQDGSYGSGYAGDDEGTQEISDGRLVTYEHSLTPENKIRTRASFACREPGTFTVTWESVDRGRVAATGSLQVSAGPLPPWGGPMDYPDGVRPSSP